MQFILTQSYRYWWPVRVRIPDPETPGKIVEQILKVQFEPKPRDAQLADQEAAARLTSLRELTEHDIRVAREIIVNWDDVTSKDGHVPFTPENLELALQQPWFRKAIQTALQESMNGEEARLGN